MLNLLQLLCVPLFGGVNTRLLRHPRRDGCVRDTGDGSAVVTTALGQYIWGGERGVRDLQEVIHLVDREALGFGQEEEGPKTGQHHPGREEEPGAVAERAEDVRHRLGDDELHEPLHERGEGAGEIAHGAREDLGRHDPRNTVEAKGPATGRMVSKAGARDAAGAAGLTTPNRS